MAVIGRLQPQQRLQQAMQAGGVEEVPPAHHVGDPLQMVVHHHGDVIAGGNVAPPDHGIAPERGLGGDVPRLVLLPIFAPAQPHARH